MDNVNALIHNSFLHGDKVEPLTEQEAGCLEEIRDVLKRHGKLDRFGITLLHKHFDIADDEILVEDTDEASRTQTIRPMKRSVVENLGGEILETCWSLSDSKVFMGCRRACVKQDNSHYGGVHVHNS